MYRLSSALLVCVLLAMTLACTAEEKHPIVVQVDRVTVINLTDTAWSDVEVWLNDHYRAQASSLLAGQRLDVPIGVFIAGFGQRFDPKKQSPFGIEVVAKGADGKPVRLIWGQGRRR
jgi:hypothetical protein